MRCGLRLVGRRAPHIAHLEPHAAIGIEPASRRSIKDKLWIAGKTAGHKRETGDLKLQFPSGLHIERVVVQLPWLTQLACYDNRKFDKLSTRDRRMRLIRFRNSGLGADDEPKLIGNSARRHQSQ